jgi:uncharacterized protein YraI
MLLKKIGIGGAAAAAALLVSSAAALAAPAVAESTVNVRAGPGTNYPVLARMRTGERVNVDRCIPGFRWCHVQRNGTDGWVAATSLRDFRQRPFERYAFSFNIPQLGFTIGLGQSGLEIRPNQPPRPPQVARVCFYEHANYAGSSFCALEGQANARLGQTWNDKISSIRVEGGAQLTVCEHWDYQGSCQVYRGNVAFVGNNDTISSYRVT